MDTTTDLLEKDLDDVHFIYNRRAEYKIAEVVERGLLINQRG